MFLSENAFFSFLQISNKVLCTYIETLLELFFIQTYSKEKQVLANIIFYLLQVLFNFITHTELMNIYSGELFLLTV